MLIGILGSAVAAAEVAIFTSTAEGSSLGFTEDSFLAAGGSREENFSTRSILSIDLEDGSYDAETRALIRFPKAFGEQEGQLPAHAVISQATLQLYVEDEGGAISAYRVLEGWDVEGVTWVDRGGEFGAWSEAGAAPPATEEKPFGSFEGQPGAFAVLDVTALVQDWAADPGTNFGILLRAQSDDGTDLSSSEAASEEQHPILRVEYTLADIPEDTGGKDTAGGDTGGDTGSEDDTSGGDTPSGQDTAAEGDSGEEAEDDEEEPAKGCGCATGRDAGGLALAVLLALVALGRGARGVGRG